MDSFAAATSFSGEQLLSFPTLSKRNIFPQTKTLRFPLRRTFNSRVSTVSLAKASSSESKPLLIARRIKTIAAGAVIFSAATAGLFSGRKYPALAEPPTSSVSVESSDVDGEVQLENKATKLDEISPLSSLRSQLYQKLEEGEDMEALTILRRLMSEQPAETEWKFMAARLLNEMGWLADSRKLLEEILASNPLSFEALFQNAVLMDRCGEGDAVIERLQRALELAQIEHKEAAARDVRLIMAQIQYLQRRVEEALSTYDELAREDPKDYRPYFCQGVIYTLLDRNKEAREKFAKYNELSDKKGEVNAYLQSPLSRVRLFGTGDSEI
ncbi:protein SLOW GREEN 1, chloroplastic isoform X2 [Phalaenopsis equestris]|uniref:protein SLOW GREEN 1, chloroplastic isoform X1 n=1 Tax=Phalaenopsis equestris TaxID=78828 RepID=UPI0009E59388|nr:protein SLOW GREEN 1, chloroplastic isoform X1 [Phalaenopsis equestris]XP_020575088.1 protein SLOW GREEN 1, chloroplastic isoform X2 [Phalaenopsis equestris]